jgi:hypothetical protein
MPDANRQKVIGAPPVRRSDDHRANAAAKRVIAGLPRGRLCSAPFRDLETSDDRAYEPQDDHVHTALLAERDRWNASAGTYTVETHEKLLRGVSLPAYQRIATLIFLPLRPGGAFVEQVVEIDPLELKAAQERDCLDRLAGRLVT